MNTAAVASSLGQTTLFGGLSPEMLAEVAEAFQSAHAVSGDVLMKAGDAADCMYLLVSGRLHVVVPDGRNGSTRVVAEIGRGETVGEMELISGEARSATVRASRDCELAMLSLPDFNALIERHPQMLLQISRVLVQRLKNTTAGSPGAGVMRTLAVLKAGSGGGPVSDFAAALAEHLARSGAVLRLNRAQFEAVLGADAAMDDVDFWGQTDSRIAAWLSHQEDTHRFVLFEADEEMSPWTRRCLRQADRIMLVGWAGESPALSAAETYLFRELGERISTPVELVLLHRSRSEMPSGTCAWRDLRPIRRHHHVHLGTVTDLDRLVRLLTGRALGLVLGGGGARGFAHIGVIRWMEENSVPVDLVAGTSMGSVVGAMLALGRSSREMADQVREHFIRGKMLQDQTLPLVSLMAASKMAARYRTMFGNALIEDLWTKYFCVSSNLSTGEAMVHRSGPLWKYVRASCSVPGVVPPVPDNGHLLIDGGVLNNLPADVMRGDVGSGKVIAVDINAKLDLPARSDYGASLSGVRVLMSRLGPPSQRIDVPNIRYILDRASSLPSVRQADDLARTDIDLYLHPPVDTVDMFSFKDSTLDLLIKIGHSFAEANRPALEAIRDRA